MGTTSSHGFARLETLRALSRVFGGRSVYRMRFAWHHRRWPRLRTPVRITDKIAARILAGETSLRSRELTDKLRCRELVAAVCPEVRQKRVIAVFSRLEEFSLDRMPERFVLKPNHASGLNILVFDKRRVEEREMRKTMARWLRLNYYDASFEPCYRDIAPRVFAEELVWTSEGYPPPEIQLFCVHGRVAFVEYLVTDEEQDGPFYDREWNRLPVWYPTEENEPGAPRPAALETAIDAAEKIAAGTDFLRVDFLYLEDGSLVFSETACSPWGGLFRLEPGAGDVLLGKLWEPYSPREQSLFAAAADETQEPLRVG